MRSARLWRSTVAARRNVEMPNPRIIPIGGHREHTIALCSFVLQRISISPKRRLARIDPNSGRPGKWR